MTIIKHNPKVYSNLFDELFNAFPANWGRDVEANWSSVPVNIHETEDGYHLELNKAKLQENFKRNENQKRSSCLFSAIEKVIMSAYNQKKSNY